MRWRDLFQRDDPIIDGLIAEAGVKENGQRRRYTGHDDRLRVLTEARRASVEYLRRRVRQVESGTAVHESTLRQVK